MQLQRMGSFKKVGIGLGTLLMASAISLTGASAAGNLVPVMTSNTSPAGTASASSEWAFHEAYKAFDHDYSTYYSTSSGSSGYLQYSFGTSKRSAAIGSPPHPSLRRMCQKPGPFRAPVTAAAGSF